MFGLEFPNINIQLAFCWARDQSITCFCGDPGALCAIIKALLPCICFGGAIAGAI